MCAAKRHGVTRSRGARNERDQALAEKVDAVLAALGEQDLEPAHHLRAARRDEGTEW
jgi:hypothetical protein